MNSDTIPKTTTEKVEEDIRKLGGTNNIKVIKTVSMEDPIGGAFEIVVNDSQNIREKYEAYIPSARPWLLVIDVTILNTSLTTECTG